MAAAFPTTGVPSAAVRELREGLHRHLYAAGIVVGLHDQLVGDLLDACVTVAEDNAERVLEAATAFYTDPVRN